jgi:hypothetical protein
VAKNHHDKIEKEKEKKKYTHTHTDHDQLAFLGFKFSSCRSSGKNFNFL